MTVADEVYMLYPEDDVNLSRVKNNLDHLFFKKFGEQVPKAEWNHPGTKQGIYFIGPNAEYLEAKFASSDARDILTRMKRALDRWNVLRVEKNYANKSVPELSPGPPMYLIGNKSLILEVYLRDLPRGVNDQSGARFEDVAKPSESWSEFSKWAWNRNWIGFDSPQVFVTASEFNVTVPVDVVYKIATEILVDNVRGQAPIWRKEHVKEAYVAMRRINMDGPLWAIEYKGGATMDSGLQGYSCKIFGQSVWNAQKNEFESFDWVAIGDRRGAWRFNNREKDLGPAPMGIVLSLWERK